MARNSAMASHRSHQDCSRHLLCPNPTSSIDHLFVFYQNHYWRACSWLAAVIWWPGRTERPAGDAAPRSIRLVAKRACPGAPNQVDG